MKWSIIRPSGGRVPGSNPGGAINLGSRKLEVVSRKENQYLPTTEELSSLSQDKLKNIIKTVSDVRKKKYKRRSYKKYGSLNKGFTEEELKKFFSLCKNEKAKLGFQLMAYLGLRVGEVVRINVSDIYFNKNKIRIETEKANTIDYLHLHNKVRILLKNWVRKLPKQIEANNGFLLFSDLQNRNHISKDWLRKEFRQVSKFDDDLNQVYGIAEDINNPLQVKRGERKLYRLTTHSLRHYYITKVYQQCKDPLKTQKLARHLDFKSTRNYIHLNQEEVDQVLNDVFESEKMSVDKSDVQELISLIKLWKETKTSS